MISCFSQAGREALYGVNVGSNEISIGVGRKQCKQRRYLLKCPQIQTINQARLNIKTEEYRSRDSRSVSDLPIGISLGKNEMTVVLGSCKRHKATILSPSFLTFGYMVAKILIPLSPVSQWIQSM